MKFLYPQGKEKALTFSYDDGQVFDKRLVEILNAHGMKGTFHINSGRLGVHRGKDHYIEAEELKEVYAGHEVACHGVRHLNLTTINRQQVVPEILEDRKALEKLTGGFVQGMSYAFGNYNQEIKEVLQALGIRYSRTIQDTGSFFPPEDFLEWHPTCHHKNHLLELGEEFLHPAGFYELPLMYVWGHSFEFGWSDDWSVIEAFARRMAGKDDIWYAVNGDICRYIQTVRSQDFSGDGRKMHNPGAVSVWVRLGETVQEVRPGETIMIQE